MNIRKLFCFFIFITISLSMVTGGPKLPWMYLSSFLQELYIKDEDVQTVHECEKNVNLIERFSNAFKQMKEQALEHIRKSKDGFLELPQTILTKDIENAAFGDISQILNVYRDNRLNEPMCNLITKKCSLKEASEAFFSKTTDIDDRKILHTNGLRNLDRIACKTKKKYFYFLCYLNN